MKLVNLPVTAAVLTGTVVIALCVRPIAVTKQPSLLNTSHLVKYNADKANYNKAVAEADELAWTGQSEVALRLYTALQSRGVHSPDAVIECKIASCYIAQRHYADALDAYRRAEVVGRGMHDSLVSTGRVKAQIVYLASLMKDEALLGKLVAEAQEELLPNASHPKRETFVDGPARTAHPDSQAYILFGRNLADVHHRSGTDFAYSKALLLSGYDPSISEEWAGVMSSQFHDEDAKIRILRAARPPKSKEQQRSMKSALWNSEHYRAAASASDPQSISTGDTQLARERSEVSKSYFQAFGIYEQQSPTLKRVAP